MEIIVQPKLLIEEQQYCKDTTWRLHKYTIIEERFEHIAIHNSVVGSVITLTKDEYENMFHPTEQDFYVKNWFIVPQDYNEEIIVNTIQDKIRSKPLPTYKHLDQFTILTTSMCNARCAYCYENGQRRKHMSEKTAHDIVDFIDRKHTGKRNVHITWFGGEPLYNEHIIDIISEGLKSRNISFTSSMVSNSSLFDVTKLDKYKHLWNLRRIQITLDGIYEDYNKIKNYPHESDAFSKVVENIDFLVRNEFTVVIRIHTSAYKDPMENKKVIDFCRNRWGKKIIMHTHCLYNEQSSNDIELQKKSVENTKRCNEFLGFPGISKKPISLNRCALDGGHNIAINPDGKFTGCQHYIDHNFIGDIYSDDYSEEQLRKNREVMEPLEICTDCPLRPKCRRLKMCAGDGCSCNKPWRDYFIQRNKQSLIRLLNRYKPKSI